MFDRRTRETRLSSPQSPVPLSILSLYTILTEGADWRSMDAEGRAIQERLPKPRRYLFGTDLNGR
ncbi:hypothetical protein A1356_01110 [Methylomonas koyamae]|uniref:Uncharacterized protein n=1 Tax=Methylomonas koyamae TaxID=702114 RepID=A0AA91DB05_9GAMM|nr:hypothetical protein A1356_01110 [Methylomonas koyamae]